MQDRLGGLERGGLDQRRGKGVADWACHPPPTLILSCARALGKSERLEAVLRSMAATGGRLLRPDEPRSGQLIYDRAWREAGFPA